MKNLVKAFVLYIINIIIFVTHVFVYKTYININQKSGYDAVGNFVLATIVLIISIAVINLIGYFIFDYNRYMNKPSDKKDRKEKASDIELQFTIDKDDTIEGISENDDNSELINSDKRL